MIVEFDDGDEFAHGAGDEHFVSIEEVSVRDVGDLVRDIVLLTQFEDG